MGGLGRKCTGWQTVYSPATGGMVRKCAKFSGGSHRRMSELGDLGQVGTSLKASFDAVKDVAVAALIGVGGAVGSFEIVKMLAPSIGLADKLDPKKANMESTEADIAVGIMGLGGGILLTRFIFPTKPEIGTNVAIGALVLTGIRLLLRLTGKTVTVVETAGLDYIVSEEPGFKRQYQALNVGGIQQSEPVNVFKPQFASMPY